jgi:CheY-like chemotaxis protein
VQSVKNNALPAGKAPLNVLIVEDEMLIAFDLELQVEACGHKVVGMAVDMATCQSAVAGGVPDVALMDLRLKGGDRGEDVAQWLYDKMGVRCIFVSGNLNEGRRDRLRALNPFGFIGKPILPVHLADALAKAMMSQIDL